MLPHYEYGLDVLALLGALRYQGHGSVPEIYRALVERGVSISQRNVTYLLERYDELVALSVSQAPARCERLQAQGRLILAIDGLQPEVGHEVLWVVREVLGGEVLLARSLLSSTEDDLVPLLREATGGFKVPVVGVVSDGERSVRNAVAQVFPECRPSAVSLSLPSSGRGADVGGGSAREEGAQETGARDPAPGAGGGGRGG